MRHILFYGLFSILLSACKSNNIKEPSDTYKSGTIQISCDESFKPLIDAEIAVYQSSFPDAKIIVHYKPEAECLKDFNNDSIRMVIATRSYTAMEKKYMIDSVHVDPDHLTIARDLIAVIVNPVSKDTMFSKQELKDILTGKSKKDLIPVLDGVRETSTVRFMIDSLLNGTALGKNVTAADSSLGVIDYVAKTPNAIGFIGYGWIGNEDDPSQQKNVKKVKIAWMESTDSANHYVQPSQLFIYTKSYPMVRNLVYVIKENYEGLGHGFAHFLADMRGQLVIRRAYLMPAIIPNYIRNAELHKD